MKYVSIDLETTGLDRENDQILQFGAVIEDTEKQLYYEEIPKYSAVINYNRISGSPFALSMNINLINIIKNIPRDINKLADYKKEHNILKLEDLPLSFYNFLLTNDFKPNGVDGRIKIIAAGKNFTSFDLPFINRIPNFNEYIEIGRRSIDPVNQYIDFLEDEDLPSLDECMKRANIDDVITHDAVDDAWNVIRVLREKYV